MLVAFKHFDLASIVRVLIDLAFVWCRIGEGNLVAWVYLVLDETCACVFTEHLSKDYYYKILHRYIFLLKH